MTRIRGIAYVILAIVCGVLDIAGLSTSFVIVETASFKRTTSLWRTCIEFKSQSTKECEFLDEVVADCLKPKFRAARGIAILAIVMGFVVCPLMGVLDALGRLSRGLPSRLTLAAMAFIISVFQLVVWALQANLYNAGCDGAQSPREAGGEYGPSLPLFVTSWVLSLVMIILALALPNPQLHRDPFEVGPVVDKPVAHPIDKGDGTAAASPAPYPATAGTAPPHNPPYPTIHESGRDSKGHRVEFVEHLKRGPSTQAT